MKKQYITYGIIALVVLVVIGYAYPSIQAYFRYQKVNVSPEQAISKEVLCDVVVSNPRGIPLVKNGDLVIENINCQQQFVSNCGRFGFLSDKGTLKLEAGGGLGSATDIKISEGSSQSYSLNWCGSKLTTVFNVKLFDDGNNNIANKEVKLQ